MEVYESCKKEFMEEGDTEGLISLEEHHQKRISELEKMYTYWE